MIPRTTLIGNLTRDPELTTSKSGLEICKGSIAVNEWHKDKEDTVSYFDFVIFGALGVAFANHHKKADKACVEGRLKQNRWEQDGVKRSKIEIIADSFEFVKSDSGQSSAKGSF